MKNWLKDLIWRWWTYPTIRHRFYLQQWLRRRWPWLQRWLGELK